MLRAGILEVEAELVDVVGADHLLLRQLAGAAVVGLQLAHLRVGLRDLQGGAVAVDLHERLPGAHLLADVRKHAQGDAGGLGDDLRLGPRLQRRRAVVAGGDGAAAGLRHLHRDRLRALLVGVGAIALAVLAAALAGGSSSASDSRPSWAKGRKRLVRRGATTEFEGMCGGVSLGVVVKYLTHALRQAMRQRSWVEVGRTIGGAGAQPTRVVRG